MLSSGSAPPFSGSQRDESIIETISISQMTKPSAATDWNGQRIPNVSAPGATTDVARALGSLIGKTTYAPATLVSYTIASTTFAAMDTTNLTVPFTAISSAVDVEVSMFLSFFAIGTPPSAIGLCLFTHGTTTQVGVHVTALTVNSTQISVPTCVKIPVTGLTAGTSYQFDLAWAVDTGTGFALIKGVTSGAFAGTDAGPAMIRVYAA